MTWSWRTSSACLWAFILPLSNNKIGHYGPSLIIHSFDCRSWSKLFVLTSVESGNVLPFLHSPVSETASLALRCCGSSFGARAGRKAFRFLFQSSSNRTFSQTDTSHLKKKKRVRASVGVQKRFLNTYHQMASRTVPYLASAKATALAEPVASSGIFVWLTNYKQTTY